jgi:hypothetical protein
LYWSRLLMKKLHIEDLSYKALHHSCSYKHHIEKLFSHILHWGIVQISKCRASLQTPHWRVVFIVSSLKNCPNRLHNEKLPKQFKFNNLSTKLQNEKLFKQFTMNKSPKQTTQWRTVFTDFTQKSCPSRLHNEELSFQTPHGKAVLPDSTMKTCLYRLYIEKLSITDSTLKKCQNSLHWTIIQINKVKPKSYADKITAKSYDNKLHI